MIRSRASCCVRKVQSIRLVDIPFCLRYETMYPKPSGGNRKIDLS